MYCACAINIEYSCISATGDTREVNAHAAVCCYVIVIPSVCVCVCVCVCLRERSWWLAGAGGQRLDGEREWESRRCADEFSRRERLMDSLSLVLALSLSLAISIVDREIQVPIYIQLRYVGL